MKDNWYEEGIAAAETFELPSQKQIRLFTLPYFIASKMEAFLDRGKGDFRLSTDLEDIVTVLDGVIDADARL